MFKFFVSIFFSVFILSCATSNNEKKTVLASSHPSGDICNALSMQQPIKFLNTPIGGKHDLIIPIYIEKNHELKHIYASGIYKPIEFYGSGFPGNLPAMTHRPCGEFLSSADEAANYCHIRVLFKPIERKRYQQQLVFNYKINGQNCSKSVDVLAEGF